MKKLCFVVLIGGTVSFGAAVEPNDCSIEVLPDGPKECRFRHVDALTLSRDERALIVRWPDHYDVQDALLARNWEALFPYRPGSTVRVELSPGHRYDLVARFTDRRTGETFLGVTSVHANKPDATRSGRVRTHHPSSFEGLEPRGCTIATDIDCTDAQGNSTGTAAVECSGDTGTCSDSCSDSETACCTSTSTTTERAGDGTVISSSTVQERQQACE